MAAKRFDSAACSYRHANTTEGDSTGDAKTESTMGDRYLGCIAADGRRMDLARRWCRDRRVFAKALRSMTCSDETRALEYHAVGGPISSLRPQRHSDSKYRFYRVREDTVSRSPDGHARRRKEDGVR